MSVTSTRRAALAQGLAYGALVTVGAAQAPPRPRGITVADVITSAVAAEDLPLLCGVNLAGAEFGALPGLHGREYLYPPPDNVAAYARQGFRIIRLPFTWERLEPDLGAPFDAAEQDRLVRTVRAALALNLSVVLDPHNYAKRRLRMDGWRTEFSIGSDVVPTTAFVNFWRQLTNVFAGDDARVLLNLMNEPTDLSAADWLPIVNAAIAGIRDAGGKHLILVPGVNYTGAHSWYQSRNTLLEGVRDPLGRLAFDVHQYFDSDSSGTHPESVSGSIGAERIEAFQEWARARGFRAFLGEFNGGRNETAYQALRDLCEEIAANRDVWIGWTAWAGGPRWPDADIYNLEPWADGRPREQTQILAGYARPRSANAWAAPEAAVDIDFARKRFFGVPDLASALAVRRASAGTASRRNGALLVFGPDAPRLTDKGLLIEEARRNLLAAAEDLTATAWTIEGGVWREGAVVGPNGRLAARTLGELTGSGFCMASQAVGIEAGRSYSFSLYAKQAGRRYVALRGDFPGSSYGAFDLDEGLTAGRSGDASLLDGQRGEWQRAGLVWTPQASGRADVIVAVNDRDGNVATYARDGRDALIVWGAVLETGRFPTSFTAGVREPDDVGLQGPILSCLRAPAFTLVIETRELPMASAPCEILSADGVPLLRRLPNGVVAAGAKGRAQTAPQPLANWRMRRRVGIALDRASGRLATAVTGSPPVEAAAADWPSALRSIKLGRLGSGALNGFVVRVTCYPRPRSAAQLGVLVS